MYPTNISSNPLYTVLESSYVRLLRSSMDDVIMLGRSGELEKVDEVQGVVTGACLVKCLVY